MESGIVSKIGKKVFLRAFYRAFPPFLPRLFSGIFGSICLISQGFKYEPFYFTFPAQRRTAVACSNLDGMGGLNP